MTPEILRALQGSIEKWEKIIAGTGEDMGTRNCPLCQLFWPGCRGCPVMDNTGKTGCDETPYEIYSQFSENDDDYTEKRNFWAQQEVDFLRSLLPNDT